MDEYITKEQALQAVKNAVDAKDEAIEAIAAHIDAIPAAEVAPVVHARWRFVGEAGHGYGIYACTNCGSELFESNAKNYCPKCGARMDGGKDNEQ